MLFNFFQKFKRQKKIIKMVQEDDLVFYLKSLGIYQQILDKQIFCKYCNSLITLENLQALFPDENKISVFCSTIKCINTLDKNVENN